MMAAAPAVMIVTAAAQHCPPFMSLLCLPGAGAVSTVWPAVESGSSGGMEAPP